MSAGVTSTAGTPAAGAASTGGTGGAAFVAAALRARARGWGTTGSPCCLAGASAATAALTGGCPASLTGGTGRRSAGEDGAAAAVGRGSGSRLSTVSITWTAVVTAVRPICTATVVPTRTVLSGSFIVPTAIFATASSGLMRAT